MFGRCFSCQITLVTVVLLINRTQKICEKSFTPCVFDVVIQIEYIVLVGSRYMRVIVFILMFSDDSNKKKAVIRGGRRQYEVK